MADNQSRRLPRGINFLLGGTVVAIGFMLFAVLGGSFDLSIGGAPSVRIDDAMAAATK
ncbi:hypothetical protein [Jannaschia donghaensis]|uniref:Uncharacterized protein n=1 Tax=Jannaschia donghaensis TaxID=420998 RepID=A0A0M6YMB3_9RHOB|nr:hypothetical protein [Jannaschia donghaensis]CTQ50653.1 hypothetical protein JDO7802_02679 [Jannaschia donghaensis]